MSDAIQEELKTFPTLAHMGGTQALTSTPIVGTPEQEYADTFIPGKEALQDGELRVTVLGSGNPFVTRAQASASILIEVGNPDRDLLIIDLGSGSLANFAGLRLPVNKLDKVFLTHLHADHMPDLITLFGSYRKAGRIDRPIEVWGPSGSEPRFGTKHFVEAIREACNWDSESTRAIHALESRELLVTEFDFSKTQVVYERGGVTVTSFPVIHALDGAVGYRVDFAGLTVVHSGDTVPGWPLVHACEGDIDLLIHECFPPAEVFAQAMDMPIDRAMVIVNAGHTTPRSAGKVFSLVKPRMAGLWHTLLASPEVVPLIFIELRKVYDGPVVQSQDLTVFNVTGQAVVARQAQIDAQPPTIPGKPRESVKPQAPEEPAWWKDARIPIDDVLALP